MQFSVQPAQTLSDGPHQRPFLSRFDTAGTVISMPLSTSSSRRSRRTMVLTLLFSPRTCNKEQDNRVLVYCFCHLPPINTSDGKFHEINTPFVRRFVGRGLAPF